MEEFGHLGAVTPQCRSVLDIPVPKVHESECLTNVILIFLGDQIKREVSIMKMVRHPNVVRLHEVLASRAKIYIVLEFVAGGELFDEIVRRLFLIQSLAMIWYVYFMSDLQVVMHAT